MRSHRRPVILFLGLALLLAGATAVHAQVLSLPPGERVRLPDPAAAPQKGLMVDGRSWLSLRRFTDASGAAQPQVGQGHNYHYDLGSDFVLWRGSGLQVEGMVRKIIISSAPGGDDSTWLISLSSVIIEQNIRLRTQLGPVGVGLGFHHNSGHELDRTRRRTPIHDTLRLELDTPVFRGTYGYAEKPGWRVWSRFISEYAMDTIFQEVAPEYYAGGLFLEIFSEPWIHSDTVAAFFDAAAGLLIQVDDDDERGADLDWLLRGGLRFGSEARSIALFADVQRLHDDWKADASRGPGRETEPWTLMGFGVSFRR
ncbi:MAG: hypothetical protein EA383_14760 [Spirochaetaceae bacterium]|nr:MAG: hypothetical protein EA383_14760 [Spirochaetaceae bacterium]